MDKRQRQADYGYHTANIVTLCQSRQGIRVLLLGPAVAHYQQLFSAALR